MKLDIDYLIENLTLEEKAGLCSGADSAHQERRKAWNTCCHGQ